MHSERYSLHQVVEAFLAARAAPASYEHHAAYYDEYSHFFLLYVALVALSIAALIVSVFNLDLDGISQAFHPRTPIRWISR